VISDEGSHRKEPTEKPSEEMDWSLWRVSTREKKIFGMSAGLKQGGIFELALTTKMSALVITAVVQASLNQRKEDAQELVMARFVAVLIQDGNKLPESVATDIWTEPVKLLAFWLMNKYL
jgi:hypothetical protein